jgi:hypothetical protein
MTWFGRSLGGETGVGVESDLVDPSHARTVAFARNRTVTAENAPEHRNVGTTDLFVQQIDVAPHRDEFVRRRRATLPDRPDVLAQVHLVSEPDRDGQGVIPGRGEELDHVVVVLAGEDIAEGNRRAPVQDRQPGDEQLRQWPGREYRR